MSDRIRELRERQESLVDDARAYLDQITEDMEESRVAELEESFNKAMAEYDKLDKRCEQLERTERAKAHLEEPERKDVRKPSREAKRDEPDDQVRYADMSAEERERFARDVLFTQLRTLDGRPEFNEEQRKLIREMRAQATEDPSPGGGAGGFLIPTGFQAEIVSKMKAFGPLNDGELIRVVDTATGNDLHWPTEDNTSQKGAILGENVQDTEQDLVFQEVVFGAFKYTTKIIRVSEELMQDSAFNLEAFIRDKFAERLGRILNEDLTVGTGSSEPNGVVTASSLGTTASGNSTIDFDDMIDLFHSVDPAYRTSPNVAFMLNDNTLKVLRKLKDNDGNYIWQPASAAANVPATILGVSYAINQDMADIGALTKPVIFGDMSKYVVRRVRGLTIKRLVERYADFHQVGFVGFGRWDGDILDSTAIKHIAMQSA